MRTIRETIQEIFRQCNDDATLPGTDVIWAFAGGRLTLQTELVLMGCTEEALRATLEHIRDHAASASEAMHWMNKHLPQMDGSKEILQAALEQPIEWRK